MPTFLETCWGCLRLRAGVLIIGYLHLIAALVLFIMHTIMIISFYITLNRSYGRGTDSFISIMSVIQMTILSYVISVVFLIYGATKGNRHCLLPFVSIHVMLCAYDICYELLSCLFLVSQLYSVAFSVGYVGVYIYVIYVVLSHHQELKKVSTERREDDEISIVNAV